jgi:vacuolar-type H+-ATPase subunit E/Vma4
VSRAALIEELRRKAVEDSEALWRDARAEAGNCRLEAAREIEDRRSAVAAQAAATALRLEEAAAAGAQREVREMLARATSALADRLHGLARVELARLHHAGAGGSFEALAAELPHRTWERVCVGPADLEVARRMFPQAEIVCDARIAGGMEAQDEAGRIRVSNTLETRLESAWPDILPGLVAEILTEGSSHQPVA